MSLVCCGGAAAEVTEELNVTYHLGGSYTDIFAVVPAADGGFFVGASQSNGTSLLKTNAAGDTLWSTAVLGDRVRTLVALDDGGCVFSVVTNTVEETGNETYVFGGNTTLIRVDKSGTVVWQQELQGIGAGDFVVTGKTIAFAGWFWETNTGFTQSYLLSSGAPGNDQIRLGNETSPKIPLSMLVEKDGTLVLTGGTTAYTTGESTHAWIATVKNGVVTNENIIRTGSADPTYGPGACAYSITRAQDGGYLVVGSNPPFGVTWASGIAWAAHVGPDLSPIWVNELNYCYAPYGVVQFGDGYLIAGMDGNDRPVWLSLSVGGAPIKRVTVEEQGRFNDVASISAGKAVLVGYSYVTGAADGLLITLKDTNTPEPVAESDTTGLWIACGILGILIIAGVVYFVVIKKPSPKSGKKSAKKGDRKT